MPKRNKNEVSRWELESNEKASEWKDLENITVEQGPCGDKPPNTDTGADLFIRLKADQTPGVLWKNRT